MDVNGAEKHAHSLCMWCWCSSERDKKKIRANSSAARVHFISLASTGPSWFFSLNPLNGMFVHFLVPVMPSNGLYGWKSGVALAPAELQLIFNSKPIISELCRNQAALWFSCQSCKFKLMTVVAKIVELIYFENFLNRDLLAVRWLLMWILCSRVKSNQN